MDAQDRDRKKAWKAAERSTAKQAFPLADELLEEFLRL